LPDYLSHGKLFLLSKDGKQYPNIENTRPLVVMPIITKIIEKTLLIKLS